MRAATAAATTARGAAHVDGVGSSDAGAAGCCRAVPSGHRANPATLCAEAASAACHTGAAAPSAATAAGDRVSAIGGSASAGCRCHAAGSAAIGEGGGVTAFSAIGQGRAGKRGDQGHARKHGAGQQRQTRRPSPYACRRHPDRESDTQINRSRRPPSLRPRRLRAQTKRTHSPDPYNDTAGKTRPCATLPAAPATDVRSKLRGESRSINSRMRCWH